MKKKVVLIAVVILVSIGLINISKAIQGKYINKNDVSIEQKDTKQISKDTKVKEDNKLLQSEKKNTENNSKVDVKSKDDGASKENTDNKTVTQEKNTLESKTEEKATQSKVNNAEKPKTVTKETVIQKPEAKKEPNLIIKDDISGKVILSVNIDTENKTVGEITLNILQNKDISYKATGRGETVYFSMIDNLKVRESGPLSGWCYYVNGSKPSVSCGAYKLNKNDIIEWKYLKDGVNN